MLPLFVVPRKTALAALIPVPVRVIDWASVMPANPVVVGATFAAFTANGVANVEPIEPEPVVRFTLVAEAEPVPVILPLPLVITLTVLEAPVAARAPLIMTLPFDTPSVLLSTTERVPAAVRLALNISSPVPR